MQEYVSLVLAQATLFPLTVAGVVTTYIGDEVTLIDLSNVIDLFGVKNTEPAWEDAKYYDYNNNGEIDIYDITVLARKVKI